MTPETQALVNQLREWVDGQSVTYASVLMQDAAAALSTLSRDLAAARACPDCQQPLACPAGTAERIAGLEAMHEETLTRAERAEADLAAARQERDAALAPPVVQDAAPEWCHAESPKPREDDDPFVCTLKRGHAGNHIAEDVYGQVQDSWPAAAKAGGEAVRLAREIVNSWACVARTKRDLDYIHACHKKIDALEAAAPTLSPAQRETLTIFADCIDDELSGSETRGFTEAVVAVDRERYDALRAALAATETPK